MSEERTHDEDVYIDTDQHEEDYEFAEMPKWPKVVGIISIVFAALGIGCSGCGVVSAVFLMPMMVQNAPDAGALPPSMQFDLIKWVYMTIGIVWAALLLIAGVATASRKYIGRPLHLAYGLGAVLLALFGIWLQIDQHQQMLQFVKDNPDSQWVKNYGVSNLIIGIALTIGFGMSWPIFCLVWFGAIKKTQDDMTGGVQEPAA